MTRGRVLLGIAGLFVLLVILRIHGYSTPRWHASIDGTEATELAAGEPRSIRADDWYAEIPLAISQTAHTPPFPAVNTLIGLGEPTAASPIRAPTASPVTLFRPQLWGWFMGPDVGLAWNWWMLMLGLPVAFFFAAEALTRATATSAALAAVLATSHFFNIWSFHYADIPAAGCAAIALMSCTLRAPPGSAWRPAVGLGAALCVFALNIYPADQLGMGVLVAAVGIALIVRCRREGVPAAALRRGVGAICVAAATAGVAIATFVVTNQEQIATLRASAYPGARFYTGGEAPWWQTWSSTLLLPAFVRNWSAFGNPCEAAALPALLPTLAIMATLGWRRISPRARPMIVCLAAVSAAAHALMVFGVPDWFARGTLLHMMREGRARLPLGIADLLLLGVILTELRDAPWRTPARLAVVGLTVLVAALALLAFERAFDFRVLGAWVAGIPALAAFAWLATASAARARALALVAIGVPQLCISFRLNPIVQGGAAYLRENPVSVGILAAHRDAPAGARWAVFGNSSLANLPRMIGVPCINGTLPTPQPELWRHLDADDRHATLWNRYAHFVLLAGADGECSATMRGNDSVTFTVDPAHPGLRELGVDCFLVDGADELVRFRELCTGGTFAERSTVAGVTVFTRR